jgi:hypothetical protein
LIDAWEVDFNEWQGLKRWHPNFFGEREIYSPWNLPLVTESKVIMVS